jgi:hypothetical protein
MKKVIFLLILTVNVFFGVAQSDTSVIIVSPIQYHAVLKRDSIIKANKAKPKVFKAPTYHGSKNFITPITVVQVENENGLKSDLPFYQNRNYTPINKTFVYIPVTDTIIVTVDKTLELQKQKEAKLLELQKQKDIIQKQKEAKLLELQKQKEAKLLELQKQKDIIQKQKEQKSKKIKKEQNRKYKKILKTKKQKNKNKQNNRDFTNQPKSERFFPTN